ncbi:PEP-utilizing enzyme [Streptomyces sp. NPDC058297]|uniref:PEP-utilizing enzyme n=1 Tax=Streptomyces sp. NPDC058297 TaxID=3346433 RepID=UPI0036E2FCBE
MVVAVVITPAPFIAPAPRVGAPSPPAPRAARARPGVFRPRTCRSARCPFHDCTPGDALAQGYVLWPQLGVLVGVGVLGILAAYILLVSRDLALQLGRRAGGPEARTGGLREDRRGCHQLRSTGSAAATLRGYGRSVPPWYGPLGPFLLPLGTATRAPHGAIVESGHRSGFRSRRGEDDAAHSDPGPTEAASPARAAGPAHPVRPPAALLSTRSPHLRRRTSWPRLVESSLSRNSAVRTSAGWAAGTPPWERPTRPPPACGCLPGSPRRRTRTESCWPATAAGAPQRVTRAAARGSCAGRGGGGDSVDAPGRAAAGELRTEIVSAYEQLARDQWQDEPEVAVRSRELGVPAIVGTGRATEVLGDGQDVTVSCAEGGRGRVYAALLDYQETETDLADLPVTRTRVMLNLTDPSAAFCWWRLPAGGVGLARLEFIVAHRVRPHPMALLHHRVRFGRAPGPRGAWRYGEGLHGLLAAEQVDTQVGAGPCVTVSPPLVNVQAEAPTSPAWRVPLSPSRASAWHRRL